MKRLLYVFAVLTAISISTPVFATHAALADERTCSIEPLSLPAFIEIAGVDEDVEPDPTEIPYVGPDGTPADPATEQAVMSQLEMVVACGNAGEFLAMMTLFSNNFIDRYFSAADLDLADVQPGPLEDDERIAIADLRDVVTRPDGTIVALVTFAEGGEPGTPMLIAFVKTDGELLIEEWQPVRDESHLSHDRIVSGDGYTGAIFPENEVATLVQPQFITQLDGAWTPTPAQIATMEAAMPAFLEASGEFSDRAIGRLPEYIRQYAGVTLDGRDLIFVNAFCDGAEQDWTTEPVFVMDGGDCFFQVRYDPATAQFVNLMVNGDA